MKIFVTGGSGFIGSNVVNFLIKKNYFVVNLDKLTYSSNKYDDEIREYGKQFDWVKIIEKYYLPNVKKVIEKHG